MPGDSKKFYFIVLLQKNIKIAINVSSNEYIMMFHIRKYNNVLTPLELKDTF